MGFKFFGVVLWFKHATFGACVVLIVAWSCRVKRPKSLSTRLFTTQFACSFWFVRSLEGSFLLVRSFFGRFVSLGSFVLWKVRFSWFVRSLEGSSLLQ